MFRECALSSMKFCGPTTIQFYVRVAGLRWVHHCNEGRDSTVVETVAHTYVIIFLVLTKSLVHLLVV